MANSQSIIANSRRLLIVDDNPAIHEDFKKILSASIVTDENLEQLERDIFPEGGDNTITTDEASSIIYKVDDAYQGEEAISMVKEASLMGEPYSVIYMDVRMPPGIDGIQTIKKIWETFPEIEMVICTAYSDYTWNQILKTLGKTDRLLFIKKPFDSVTIKQTTLSLITKWDLNQKIEKQMYMLESKVSERTRELQRMVEYLREMKMKAESATVAKSEFLSNISHEIRTPLNCVLGMLELLADTRLEDEQQEYVDTIKTSGDSLLSIVNDILNFSKAEAGMLTLEKADFNVHDAIEFVTDLIAVKAQEKGLEITAGISPDVPVMALGDSERLRQILLNIVSNSVKFTREGSIRIDVKLEKRRVLKINNEEKAFLKLKFEIKDTGVGISNDIKHILFKPFTQADISSTRSHEGTGLGLAIAKMLCELMDGKIGFNSKEGQGSLFWFTVYLEEPQKAPDTDSNINLSQMQTDVRALLISDNAPMVSHLHQVFKQWGGRLNHSDNITQARHILTQAFENGKPYQVVFVDYSDPSQSVYSQVVGSIKEDPQLEDLPFVGLFTKSKRSQGKALEGDGYFMCLSKPLKRLQLYNCIQSLGKNETLEAALKRTDIIKNKPPDELFSGDYKILVVDDNSINRKVLVKLLEKCSLPCDEASDGLLALDLAQTGKYSLILMDCLMPNMDGYEATRKIRDSGVNTPIVALTANVLDGSRDRALRSGMNDFLTKPFKKVHIISTLRKYLV